jgi:hypothetical protein
MFQYDVLNSVLLSLLQTVSRLDFFGTSILLCI